MPFSRLACTAGIAAVVATCTLGGCAAVQAPPAPSLYERLGGKNAIVALIDDALLNVAADPRINHRFGNTDAGHLKSNIVDLLCQRAGGPCVYKGRNMADAHDGMHIRDDEFDAMIEDIARSFRKLEVPAAERRESLAILGQMRNAIVGH